MKIALCLHGLFDSITDTTSKGIDGFYYIKKHILNKGDVDVYIHSWSFNEKEKILDLYKPKNFIIENFRVDDFSKIINNRGISEIKDCRGRSQINILGHFYSIQESFKLIDGEYDIVIKSRFDLGRINRNTSGPNKHNPYPVQCINFDIDKNMDKIYMANWDYFNDGPADMWFYSSQENMSNFKKLYDTLIDKYFFLDSNYAKTLKGNFEDLANAIKLLKYFMIDNNMWEKREPLDAEWE